MDHMRASAFMLMIIKYHVYWQNISLSSQLALKLIFITTCRERTVTEKIKEAHRKVMMANHPDAGGSHYLASKINEAKDVMMGKTKGASSAF